MTSCVDKPTVIIIFLAFECLIYVKTISGGIASVWTAVDKIRYQFHSDYMGSFQIVVCRPAGVGGHGYCDLQSSSSNRLGRPVVCVAHWNSWGSLLSSFRKTSGNFHIFETNIYKRFCCMLALSGLNLSLSSSFTTSCKLLWQFSTY